MGEGRRSSQQKKGSVGAKSLFSFLFLLFLSPRWQCEEKQNKKKNYENQRRQDERWVQTTDVDTVTGRLFHQVDARGTTDRRAAIGASIKGEEEERRSAAR